MQTLCVRWENEVKSPRKNMLAASPVAPAVKKLPADAGDRGSIPGLGSSPRRRSGNPVQYSCLETQWKEEPGGLRSVQSQRVGHDSSNLA